MVSVTNSHQETDAEKDEKNNRPLPLLKRRHRLTGKYPAKVVEEKALLGREAEHSAKILLEESARIRHAICGTLPLVTNYKSESGCTYGDKCRFRHVEADGQPSKKLKKSCGKVSVALLKESLLRENLFCVKREKLGSNHTVNFSQGTWHHMRVRERKGPSRGISQKCEPHERILDRICDHRTPLDRRLYQAMRMKTA